MRRETAVADIRLYGWPFAVPCPHFRPKSWITHMPAENLTGHPQRTFDAIIFDVDGVVVASPHEEAWRSALDGITDPLRLTTEIYQAHVAGKPRPAGARAVLDQLGIPDAGHLAIRYAERKQMLVEKLIADGAFSAFPDALRFILATRKLGFGLAVASSSRNAIQMMRLIRFDSGDSLLDSFGANTCGRELLHGKPHPEIFLLAAAGLGVSPDRCLVVEDASAGIEAARAGGMAALGVARLHDEALLHAAKADLVVASLDEVSTDGLAYGELRLRAGARQ
jgi:HAD superfamily hydrolase (TIGR01509 family)